MCVYVSTGWCAYYDMEALALRGGPAGEFVIWADLATGMAALGFDLVFVNSICEFWRLMGMSNSSSYDVVITDYDGMGAAENAGQFPQNHCKYYIVDGFGTQEPFNKRHLDLKKILTPYPFDRSNTPIHMITGVLPRHLWAAKRENTGILWAKLVKYVFPITDPSRRLIEVLRNISSMAPLQTSLSAISVDYMIKQGVGDNVFPSPPRNRNRTEFLQLMTASRFILGVGMPVDGPTALEAIAHGCAFINPVFSPHRQQRGKPTRFNYTSQHPFLEANFGPPHVYTIDIFDSELVEKTVRQILQSPPPPPIVHPSFRPQEYLNNLRKIFHDTPYDPGVSPRGHPGNRVYASYTEYVDTECRVKDCPASVYNPRECGMGLYNNTLHNELKQIEHERMHKELNEHTKQRNIQMGKRGVARQQRQHRLRRVRDK